MSAPRKVYHKVEGGKIFIFLERYFTLCPRSFKKRLAEPQGEEHPNGTMPKSMQREFAETLNGCKTLNGAALSFFSLSNEQLYFILPIFHLHVNPKLCKFEKNERGKNLA